MIDTLVHTLQETPANVALLIPIAYLIYDIVFPRLGLAPGVPIPTSYEEAYTWKPKTHPPTILFQAILPGYCWPLTGLCTTLPPGNPSMVQVCGVLPLVNCFFTLIDEDGPYGNFAGRDASRGMARQSFDLDMLTPVDAYIDPLKDLTPSEMWACTHELFSDWSDHFQHKYIVCGELVENHEL
ncbi:hypothetical protein BS47DRAFT_1370966 [Hydnum rufescens UP504]|uniref:Uncharacterized protein n=1 Tax=Hydnum rufescens UP504 TaxID=1448309 RepID=A0A9P6B6N8_9AGAM|nr:hypothetical protein BS47DRAFT_1370966 [Hydnum rufescens UP504]